MTAVGDEVGVAGPGGRPPPAAGSLNVFISYSRADLAFADELVAGLEFDGGFTVIIDRHSIVEGEDWKKRLGACIVDSDTIVFVLSPDSAKSDICAWEVEEACKHAKRIIPVLWRPTGTIPVPAPLAALNYVRFDEGRSFMGGLKGLVRALEADVEWLREHTRLLARAMEWERAGRADNRLLPADLIAPAKAWAARRPKDAPEPTALHLDFIRASEAAEAAKADAARQAIAERERLAAEREDAARKAEQSAKAAQAAQQDRLTALAQAEASAKETARSQTRAARLLWGVLGLVLAIFGGALWQAHRTDQREVLIYTSLAATAMNEDRHDRAMRFALQAYPAQGALPWSPFSTELEGRLAGAPTLTRLRATLRGHGGPVVVSSFSPDGKRVVTASSDQTARLWDAETGKEIAVLKAHTSDVNAASFSPDGKRVVTASDDQTARLWDAETGKEIPLGGAVPNIILKAHTASVNAASFSPDGKRVVTASSDQTARLWDAETGKEIAVLKAHTNDVNAASFSLDGKRVVTASDDQTARLWDAETGKEIAVLKAHTASVNAASFSPDGKRVVTASSDQTARLWDAETGKEIPLGGAVPNIILKAHTASVNAASFSPDGKRVVTASFDSTARLWDAETGKEIAVLKAHTGLVLAASFSPDGKRVVTASSDQTARLWDAESLFSAPAQAPTQVVKEIAVLKAHTGTVWAASFSPDGKRVVTASDDQTARLWDAESLFSAPAQAPTQVVKEIAVLKAHTGLVLAASFSPDGKRVVTASSDQTARLWDAETGKEIPLGGAVPNIILKAHTASVNAASFSPDGKRVVTASSDQTARLWDAETGKEIAVLKAHEGAALGANWRRDGRRFVTAGADNVARIWDVEMMTVYRMQLRERVCAEKLIGAQAFTDEELADPILSGIDAKNPIARNPCLRRGPLSLDYWTRLLRP